jgi:hypothetical protein
MSSNKDNNKQYEEREWRRAIAILEARIEDLKVRYDTEFRHLHSHLDARVAELQGELRKLAAVVEGDVPDTHAQLIAAKLDELRAKSDAAYDLLRVSLKPAGHNEPPKHR